MNKLLTLAAVAIGTGFVAGEGGGRRVRKSATAASDLRLPGIHGLSDCTGFPRQAS